MTFNNKNRQVFEQLGFTSAPNLFVSQPHIVLVPEDDRDRYLREMKWVITFSDDTLAAHKFLEFINKRTDRSIDNKAQTSKALTVIGALLGVLTFGAILFVIGKPLFLNRMLWSCLQYNSQCAVLFLKQQRGFIMEDNNLISKDYF